MRTSQCRFAIGLCESQISFKSRNLVNSPCSSASARNSVFELASDFALSAASLPLPGTCFKQAYVIEGGHPSKVNGSAAPCCL